MRKEGKRFASLLLAVLLAVSLLPTPVFAAEAGDTDAFIEEKTVEEPVVETAVEGSVHEHSWGEWAFSKEPTCTEDGERERICAECGEIQTEAVPGGHAWGEWTVTAEPTCAEDGEREHSCAACDLTESETIPALGHTWGEWTVLGEPACDKDGEREHTCSVCGVTEKEAIPALGHEWGEWTVLSEPACDKDGEREHTCAVCGVTEKEAIPALGHDWGEWEVTKEATFKEAGERKHTCAVCGLVATEEIPRQDTTDVLTFKFGDDGEALTVIVHGEFEAEEHADLELRPLHADELEPLQTMMEEKLGHKVALFRGVRLIIPHEESVEELARMIQDDMSFAVSGDWLPEDDALTFVMLDEYCQIQKIEAEKVVPEIEDEDEEVVPPIHYEFTSDVLNALLWAVDTGEPLEGAEPEPEPEDEPETKSFTEPLTKVMSKVTVTVTPSEGAFTEPVELIVFPLLESSQSYQNAEAALAADGTKYDGMLAFDISFRSVTSGEYVEPDSEAGGVAVEIVLNEAALAAVDSERIDASTVEVTHIASEGPELVADTADKAEGLVTVSVNDADAVEAIAAEFTVESFSTFVIHWTNADDEEESATVHWGTYEDEEFNEFNSTTTVDFTASSVDLAVIVDNDYYYVGAEYKSVDGAEEALNLKSSVIRKSDGQWVMTMEDSSTKTVENGSHIYVNYAPKSDGTYVAPPKPTGDVLAPETAKDVSDNHDGTFTIRLDITGKEDETVTQVGANVIIVMDITQSMTNAMPDGSGSRMAAAKNALNKLITTLEPDVNLINFTAVNFGVSQNGATLARDWTTQTSQMTAYVTSLPNNPNDYGTNWKAGLLGGRSRVENATASSTLSNNETYVIFVTDGNPNCYTDNNGRWHGSTGPNFDQNSYNAAVATANWLGANSHFYGVFVGDADGFDHLEDLVTGANGEDVINGSNSQAIEDAFAGIAQTIKENLGAGNTTVDDGIPTLSNVSANVSAGDAGGFTYYIKPAGGQETEWVEGATGPDDKGAPGASYDKNNGVTWNLGEVGTLKNDWVYSIEFTVWPSQAAYDLIADLNNGIVDFEDLTEEQQASVEGSKETGYTLKTNTHLYTTFTDLAGNTYREENDASAAAMPLPTETISVEKIWHNWLDSRTDLDIDGLQLVLSRDGQEYKEFDVSSPTWKADDIYISCGQIVGGKIVETGHDYYVTEKAKQTEDGVVDKTEYWEVNSPYYHPMIVDGVLKVFIQKDDATNSAFEYNNHKYVEADSTAQTLSAVNERVSWLNLTKQVTGDGAPEEVLFEYSITIDEKADTNVFFSVFGDSNYMPGVTTSATEWLEESTGRTYYYAPSGSTFTLSIKAGWSIRFLNLATGTTYTITEVAESVPDGFALEASQSVETLYVGRDSSGRIPADGYPITTTFNTLSVTGEVKQTNTDYSVTFTNKYELTDVTVYKSWEDNSDQDGIRPDPDEYAEYLTLLANGATYSYDGDVEVVTVTGNTNSYSITYKDVPKYIENEEVEYSVQEDESQLSEYTASNNPAKNGETITNSYTPETVDITVEKSWANVDGSDTWPDGVEVTIQLLANSVEVEGKSVTLTEDQPSYTFTGLPKKDAGVEIEYSADEVDVAGYDSVVSALADGVITVTNSQATTEVEVDKEWVNAGGGTDWPDGVTVTIQLLADGSSVDGQTATLSSSQTSYKFSNLPKANANGQDITYSVEETAIAGYTGELSTDDDGKITITNTQETTQVEVDKTWVNADGGDDWPDGVTVTIQLLADSEAYGDTVDLDAEQPSYTFTDLPKISAEGTEIAYSVDEVQVTGYTSEVGTISDGKITITNTQETTEVEVDKEWLNADESTTWPTGLEVTVQLLADGATVDGKTATLNEKQTSYTFSNLPKTNADGKDIAYSVSEAAIAGYTGEVGANEDGKITITNTQETTEVEVDKEWLNADGSSKWPDGVTVEIQLMADGATVDGKTATLSSSQTSYKFSNLPKKNADGDEIAYSVKELEVTGYASIVGTISDGKITVTNSQETTQVEVDKEWLNADGSATWPDGLEVTVQLLADGATVDGKTATLTSKQTSYTFTDLPKKNAQGADIVYSVSEAEITGYTGDVGAISDGKITITNSQETTEVEVDKEWVNADGSSTWPSGVTVEIQLMADGATVDGKTATLSSSQTSYKFSNLPKTNASGDEIEYSVDEVEVAGYASDIADIKEGKITVTNSQETVDVEVDKEWANADGTDTWPSGVTVSIQLTAEGNDVSGKTATLSADQPNYTFTSLPKYQADGKTEIKYSVKELDVAGYASDIADIQDGKITVTNSQETTDVEVDKEWLNADGSSEWPDGVTAEVQLLADGETVDGKTATLSKDQPSYTFEGLAKYQADGKTEITYSVAEVEVAGYVPEVGAISNGVITVTNAQETTEVEVDKEWVNADGSNTWPSGVTVDIQLLADGASVDGKTATLSASQTSYTFTNLAKYQADGTTEIEYSVDELEIAGYVSEVGEISDGVITVTNEQETVDVEVDKTWVNADGTDTWPSGVTVSIQLTAEGNDVSGKTATLSADQPSYTFTSLPKYQADGETEIEYSVKELEVAGYAVDIADIEDGKITVTNSQKTVDITVEKKWKNADGSETWPDGVTVEIQLLADGETVDGKTATLSADQPSYTFESLPQYQADGKTEIVYDAAEVEVVGFNSEIGALTEGTIVVTNTQIKTTVTVSKEWDDKDNQDGKRTTSVSVQLMANGKTYGEPVELSDSNEWTYTWQNLPAYEGDEPVEYTVDEPEVPAEYTADISDPEGDIESGYTIKVVNKHEVEKIDVSGKKTWDDKNNQDGKRPKSITINLFADGVKKTSITVTEADGWAWNFKDLDKNANGKEIKYTITEDPITGYVATVKGYDVTNTRTYDKLLPTGQLKWPIPVFGGLGLLLAGYGVLTLLKKRKDEET